MKPELASGSNLPKTEMIVDCTCPSCGFKEQVTVPFDEGQVDVMVDWHCPKCPSKCPGKCYDLPDPKRPGHCQECPEPPNTVQAFTRDKMYLAEVEGEDS